MDAPRPGPISDFDLLVESDLISRMLERANELALLRRRTYLRSKGRPLTERGLDQWIRTKLVHERAKLVAVAARMTQPFSDHPMHRWIEMEWALVFLIGDAVERKSGRRRALRPGGLLAQAGPPPGRHSEKLSGRPRSLTKEDARAWLAFVYGIKLALYEKRRGMHKSGSPDQAIKRLRLDPRRDPAISPTAWLDAEVSDTVALATEHARRGLQGTPSALVRRLQRIRAELISTGQRYQLPGTQSQSGGN